MLGTSLCRSPGLAGLLSRQLPAPRPSTLLPNSLQDSASGMVHVTQPVPVVFTFTQPSPQNPHPLKAWRLSAPKPSDGQLRAQQPCLCPAWFPWASSSQTRVPQTYIPQGSNVPVLFVPRRVAGGCHGISHTVSMDFK